MKFASRVLYILLGAVLLMSGSAKLQRPIEFLHVVLNYEILSGRGAILFAGLLPWLEIIIGCALLSGVMPRVAAMFAVALSCIFVGATGIAWIRGMQIPCGCFGSTEVISGATVARSAGMLALAGVVWWLARDDAPRVSAVSTAAA